MYYCIIMYYFDFKFRISYLHKYYDMKIVSIMILYYLFVHYVHYTTNMFELAKKLNLFIFPKSIINYLTLF